MANNPLPEPTPMGGGAWIGATSVSLGLIGLALSWLPPYSIVIGLFGVICGVIGLTQPSGRRGNGLLFAAGGTALSLLAVVVCAFLMPGWWAHPWPWGGP